MKAGDTIELEVQAIDDRGQGVASVDERSVLIPGLFPGERGEVRIEALSRHAPRAHGRLKSLLRPSPARRALPCSRHEHYDVEAPAASAMPDRPKPACGGCPLMALEIDAQREAKRALVAREFQLELDTLIGAQEFGYRWSSKRVVSGRAGRLILGSRVAGRGLSKAMGARIADMRGCLVDHPLITAALAELEDRGNVLGIEPWHEHGGELRYVWAKTNGASVILTLITGAAPSPAILELSAALVQAGVVAGVAHSVQAGSGNVIRGEAPQVIAGVDELSLELEGAELRVGPLGFLQPNPIVAAQAYRELVGSSSSDQLGSLACDLYAGAGVTTALLRERFAEVVPCESYPESAAALGVAPQTAEAFCQQWLESGREAPALIVANPPRAGLGERVCADLAAIGAPRVHIMSCNPATLRADLDRLAPRYELVGVRGYDTLPQTPHLELVAWLRLR